MKTDAEFMDHAKQLALKAKGMTSPNPMVGSIVVRGNKIVAEGWHKRCGADHAEVVALKKAGQRARGATMYVSLEPCQHHGRTPPCTDGIINSGIKKVVIGMKDPNPLMNGKSISKLKRAGIKTKVGILKSELTQLNEVYVKYVTQKMPFVAAKSAQTIDGKIATSTGHSKWITSKVSREKARRIRDEFDAILVGINTVLSDDPRLIGTHKTKGLKKIVVDSRMRISPKAKLLRGCACDCTIAVTKNASKRKIDQFRKKGVNVLIDPGRKKQVSLRWLFRELAQQEVSSLLIEGGAKVIGQALKEKLVDKMYIYIAPKIIGEQKALSSVEGLNIKNVKNALELKNIEVSQLGKDILLSGYVYGNR